MLLTPYASGSSGNAYDICDGHTRLLLECGLSFKRLQEVTRYGLSSVAGVLISHEHMDHAKSAHDLSKRGVDIYATPGTLEALHLAGPNVHPVEYYAWFRIGSLFIQPFVVYHDVAQPCGYIIASVLTHERAVFATDTYKLPHTFPGATEIALECNYSDELIMHSNAPDSLKKRIKRNHMSLESCKDFLSRSDLSTVQRLTLIHLSAERSDASRFKREIEAQTGKEVVIA